MKILGSIFLVLLFSFSASAQMAFVQDDENTAATTNPVAVAMGSNVTAGSCIVGAATWVSGTVTLTSLVQSAGTATIANSVGTPAEVNLLHNPITQGGVRTALFYALVTGTGSLTMTLTLSGSATKYLLIHEASNCNTTTQLRGSNLTAAASTTTDTDALVSGTAAPATAIAGDYSFGYFVDVAGSGVTFTAGTDFTLRVIRNNVHFSESSVLAKTQATGTWTITGATIGGVVTLQQVSSACGGGLTMLGVGRPC